jgi:ABC-type lipopolysaccharide export system ATPase subunit
MIRMLMAQDVKKKYRGRKVIKGVSIYFLMNLLRALIPYW